MPMRPPLLHLIMALVAGCSPATSDTGFDLGGPQPCTPGEQRACACPGGALDGAQICSDAGDRFGACFGCDPDDTGDFDGGSSDATTDADASTAVDDAGDDTPVTTSPTATTDDADTGGTTDVPDGWPTDPPQAVPDGWEVVEQVALEHPDWLAASCVDTGGDNQFLFEVVRRLRMLDDRWGLNWKRGVVGDMSQDVVDYHWGEGASDQSTEVFIIDMIGGHCGDDPQPAWIDVTQATADAGTIGMWTLAGQDL
jgi:hypothetical protein